MGEPIWIPCEGSGQPLNNPGQMFGSCAMCGKQFIVHDGDGIAWPHQRKDVLAMLARGDFGG